MAIKRGLRCQLRGRCMIDDAKKMDYEAMLYLGKSINYQNIYIKSWKYNDIVETIGLSNALQLFNLSTITRKKFKDIDEGISLFELFLHSELNEMLVAFLHTFVEFDEVEYGEKTNAFYFKRGDEIGILNKDNFEEFLEVFRMAYCIDKESKESDRDDIDEEMRELLLGFEDEENKIRNAKGNTITLNSMVKAVAVKHNSLNCLSIGECTIYQIKCDLIRLYQIDASVYINTGIYTGNISLKDIDIEEYNFAKEIK